MFLAMLALLTANWIVSSGRLMTLINSHTDSIHVTYSSASGDVLSTVHFKHLVITGKDDTDRWELRMDDVTFKPTIWNLPKKMFQASEVHGSGVSFSIDLFPSKNPGPPGDYHGNWRLYLSGIQLDHIRNVRIDSFRLPVGLAGGNATLQAAFKFWPSYELEISPSRYIVDDRRQQIDLAFQLNHLRFQDRPDLTFFRDLTATLRFQGTYTDLTFLNNYFSAVPGLTFTNGSARADANIELQHGLITHRSRAKIVVDDFSVWAAGHRARGSGELVLRSSSLAVRLLKYRAKELALQGARIGITLIGEPIDLVYPLGNVRRAKVEARGLRLQALNSNFSGNVDLATDVRPRGKGRPGMRLGHFDLFIHDLFVSDREHPQDFQIQNWSGRVQIPLATVVARPRSSFVGIARISSPDGKPVFVLLKNAGAIGINLAGLLPMRDLTAGLSINYHRHRLILNDIELHSSSLQAQGGVAIEGKEKYGDIIIKAPPFTFRLAFDGEKTSLKG